MYKYNRIYYLDFLKFIAILAVILVHVSAPFVVTSEINSLNYWVGHSVDSVFRFGTLIFVMITGALLLDENYEFSYKKNWHHILRFFICFIIWSLTYVVIYEVINPAIKGIQITSFDVIVKQFFKGHVHLWYLVMAIGLYLLIPLLRLWVKKENKKQVEYFLILSLIFCSTIPLILDILRWFQIDLYNIDLFIENFNLYYVVGYVPFLILGWYLHNYDIKRRYILYILALLSIGFTIVASWGFSSLTGKRVLLYESNYVTTGLVAFAVFLIFKHLFIHKEPRTRFWSWNIHFIAKHSLGFYPAHVGFSYMMSRILDRNWTNNALVVIPISFLAGFLLSYLLSWIFSLIPFMRKLV